MFSNAGKYAIRAVLYMATQKKDGMLGNKELAAALGVPAPFLGKILQQLESKQGLISSVKGPGGGFYLSREQLLNPLLEVILTIDGNDVLGTCILGFATMFFPEPLSIARTYSSVS
ncbi:MAG: Rrf2 family transcriptional regulator [Saprospiraceae bacterium]